MCYFIPTVDQGPSGPWFGLAWQTSLWGLSLVTSSPGLTPPSSPCHQISASQPPSQPQTLGPGVHWGPSWGQSPTLGLGGHWGSQRVRVAAQTKGQGQASGKSRTSDDRARLGQNHIVFCRFHQIPHFWTVICQLHVPLTPKTCP